MEKERVFLGKVLDVSISQINNKYIMINIYALIYTKTYIRNDWKKRSKLTTMPKNEWFNAVFFKKVGDDLSFFKNLKNGDNISIKGIAQNDLTIRGAKIKLLDASREDKEVFELSL